MIRDDFAGPGGWDEGLRLLGLTDVVGVEWDRWACETAVAAGHRRVQADVTTIDPGPWECIDGYVASPPCTSFSAAGKGEGARALESVVSAARRVAAGLDEMVVDGGDPTTALILEPVRQVRDLRPRWVALEQVPPCLPVWQEYARIFRTWGYSATAAVLCAADFGVPQTRRRAILVARLDGPAVLPDPSHGEVAGETMFGSVAPWTSMAEALGWGFTQRPSTTLTAGSNRQGGPAPLDGGSGARAAVRSAQADPARWTIDRRTNSRGPGGTTVPTVGVSVDRPAPAFTGKSGSQWVVRGNNTIAGGPLAERSADEPAMTVGSRADLWAWDRPATTIVSTRGADVVAAPGYRGVGGPSRQDAPGSVRITPQEAAVLQSFPADYPWRGGKTAVFRQVGNAVPPRLAAAVVGALLGLDWQAAVG